MIKPASDLIFKEDYPSFPEFERYGLPMNLIDSRLVLNLQYFREDSGIPLILSSDPECFARIAGSHTSRHWAVDRLADAGDVFPKRGRAIEAFLKALQVPYFGAVGIYADTNGPDGNPWPMLHLDRRELTHFIKTVWVRFSDPIKNIKHKYIYLGQSGFNNVIKEITRLDRESMG